MVSPDVILFLFMTAINRRPIIFPLPNPALNADAVEHTRGSVLFASDSLFPEQQYMSNCTLNSLQTCVPLTYSLLHSGLGLGAIPARMNVNVKSN